MVNVQWYEDLTFDDMKYTVEFIYICCHFIHLLQNNEKYHFVFEVNILLLEMYMLCHMFGSFFCCTCNFYVLKFTFSFSDTYTLSVRDCDELRGYLVKHYKIHKETNNDGLPCIEYYYITPKRRFRSLQDLVTNYSGEN